MTCLWPLPFLLAGLTPVLLNAAEDHPAPSDPLGPTAPATIILNNQSSISVEVMVNHRLQGASAAGSLCRIAVAGELQSAAAVPTTAAPTPARWKSHGGWSTDQLPVLTLRAILPDGQSVQVEHVLHGDSHGRALVWFSFADAPGQPPGEGPIATAVPLSWGCAVPATPAQITASLTDLSTDAAVIAAVTDFYDHKGFWAGKFHLQDCISIARGPVHDGVSTAYIAYHYQPLQQGLPFGIDQRSFTLVTTDGRPTVTAMGDYQSAADGGCRLMVAGDPALDIAAARSDPQALVPPAANPAPNVPVPEPPVKAPSAF